MFERVWRGRLSDLTTTLAEGEIQGEYVLVIAGKGEG
jgi:16S rRNA C1402 (ribose-2'-O) methylase RsmI